MGSGMARRLLANGFPLTVFNRNPEKSKPFAAEGARVANSPREAAAQAEVIISMVADDNASRSLWLGENGALAAAKPGTVCIECSTVTVDWVRELAAAAAKTELRISRRAGDRQQNSRGDRRIEFSRRRRFRRRWKKSVRFWPRWAKRFCSWVRPAAAR